MTGGSQQLRLYRRARRDGLTRAEACALSGITETEAQIHDAADRHSPPPPEAFELLYDPEERNQTMTDETPDPEAGEGGGIDGEYKRPDAAAALKIFKNEIAPKMAHMATIKGDLSDPYKRIKDDCNFPRKVLDFAMQLDDMEEAKRDHWLLALSSILNELKLFVPRDLVTMASGDDGADGIPTGEREADDDLATLSDDFDEASEDEVAQQKPRADAKAKKKATEPKAGTGAAARKAMSSASAEAGVTVN